MLDLKRPTVADPAAGNETLLTQIQAAARDTADAALLRRYFETATADALRQRPAAALAALALGHARFASTRAPGEVLVRVMPPRPEQPVLAALETCVDDQPFLVDSILLAIRDAGAAVDWLVHPVMTVTRNAAGAIAAEGEARSESWIHIEFEALPAPEDYARLSAAIREVLADLRRVVDDYPAALLRVRAAIAALEAVPASLDANEFAEAREFLHYLDDGHFTFLGYVETRTEPLPDGGTGFRNDAASGLGLLRADTRWAAQDLIAPQAELDKYVDSARLVVVTKANFRSVIHRNELIDVVSIKRFASDGSVAGTLRFVGLFSSEVYIDRPRHIPLIRRKAAYVMARSRLAENSHSGKNLRDILHGLPRDELFQSGEDDLFDLCMGVRALRERHQLRLFARRDRYGRFYSFLLYLPRERYSRELRDKAIATLVDLCGGLSVDRSTEFLRGEQARIHITVRTPPGTTVPLTPAEIEARVLAATRTWREDLREALLAKQDVATVARFADAFPLAYSERVDAAEAALDVGELLRLSAAQPVRARLAVAAASEEQLPHATGLTLYALSSPIALSDVLPTLENFGFKVVSQELAEVQPRAIGGDARNESLSLWVQHFEVRHRGCSLAPETQRRYFEAAFAQVWRGEVENDGFNRLVLSAGLDARQVTVLRAICKYLVQTALPFGQSYIEALLAEHTPIARLLARLFEARFAPDFEQAARRKQELEHSAALDHALDQVASLDGDRVLRAFLSVIRATLRTNAYQPGAAGATKRHLSFKLDPALIAELPLPRPMFEIWVYSPDVEGVHLRGGRVARGGLRWSDRRADFRTEVLGLMKAQMVKNTVIVPVGAKGGFVVKKPVDASQREAWLAQGQECYRTFLRGLLDLTDNRVGEAIVPPPDVLRYDGDDPYLVVAADKGTATFSDIANSISAEYGFWLGDAFASGGSAGYDHKKMGITARGAWESVKRHFREVGVTGAAGGTGGGSDCQTEPFTCVGIGDMSGDVFGNGMLLSPVTRLLAAFDHRHIFIDPNPDAATSLAERQRLFDLPRSSWADYDAAKISAGGGVWPRSAKLIKLSGEARAALGISAAQLSPNELMRAILRAPVDLLFNGGIGTYVKAHTQSHGEVGDRANDAIRVDGRDVRAKVIGEGGNLGCTQLGRIEYALHGAGGSGGRINTDAIDNAGGVHTSDREVNIKIVVNAAEAAGTLTRASRDTLLASMTADIAAFVLRDSYVQSGAISLLAANAAARFDDHAELMRMLEREGLLNQAIEFLPDEDQIKERKSRGQGLTRPELAVLVAYSKISLKDAILKSAIPDDPFFVRDLLANFPAALIAQFRDALAQHQLRREIVATILSNALVNRMGAGFAQLWADDHGLSRAEVIKAYATAHEIFGGDNYWLAIETLDNQVPAALQQRLMNEAIGLLKHATGWFAGSAWATRPVGEAVTRFVNPLREVAALLPDVLPSAYREDYDRAHADLEGEGVPPALARRLANARALGGALDIAELAEAGGLSLTDTATAYFLLGERLRLPWLIGAISALPVAGKWQSLSRVNLRDDAWRLHRQLASQVIAIEGADPAAKLDAWARTRERRLRVAADRLAELQAAGTRDYAGLAVAVREIGALAG